jgi:hypothetical protein
MKRRLDETKRTTAPTTLQRRVSHRSPCGDDRTQRVSDAPARGGDAFVMLDDGSACMAHRSPCVGKATARRDRRAACRDDRPRRTTHRAHGRSERVATIETIGRHADVTLLRVARIAPHDASTCTSCKATWTSAHVKRCGWYVNATQDCAIATWLRASATSWRGFGRKPGSNPHRAVSRRIVHASRRHIKPGVLHPTVCRHRSTTIDVAGRIIRVAGAIV